MTDQEARNVSDPGAGATAVTAVVVNWNAGPHLEACVGAVRGATGVTVAEVIVVDNASSDGSTATVAGTPGVRIIETGANLGYGTGANRGLQLVQTEYVAILNPDLVLDAGALRTLIDVLEEDPIRVLAGPHLTDADGRATTTCGDRPGLSDAIGRKFLLHLVFPFLKFRRLRPATPAKVGWVTGACMVARRSALESIGGFDEAIFMYFEDLDLCARLTDAGGHIWYVPTARARHTGGRSSSQALGRMLLASERSYRYYTRKHLGRGAGGFLTALTPIEMLLRSILWLGLYAVSGRRRPEARARLRAYRRLFVNDFRGATPPSAPTDS